MVSCALLVPSAQYKCNRGRRYDNGYHLDRGRQKAASRTNRGCAKALRLHCWQKRGGCHRLQQGMCPASHARSPIGVLKRNIPRPKAPSIKASVSGPCPKACKRWGKTGMMIANPVMIRVTQPIRNSSAMVIDLACMAGESALDRARPTFSTETVTVSCSRIIVLICSAFPIVRDASDNTLVSSPLPSLTPVVLFPSLLYSLQIASNLSLCSS